MDTRKITTGPDLVFDCSVAGKDDAPLVLMLHGFGVSRHFWDKQVPALAGAGYFAVAPNQRGYSPGARPDPRDLDAYKIDRLVQDALDIVAAAGHGDKRFHLVGHDWGGSLSWIIAARHPERLRSLTMLSRPHPASFLRALAMPDGEQKRRSGHHTAFLEPDAVPKLLANDCEWLRSRHMRQGMPKAATDAHMSVLGNEAAMEAALAWYRSSGPRQPLGPVKVPTLYLWGDNDDTVGRVAAEGTAEFIDAPYRFEVLRGVGHYAADQVPDRVNQLLLEQLRQYAD
ncbi:MAG: alpha/beta hydrolase [Proteobacteria bacterium]|nr:alpha/beta hydrolase [Pseudomonadota bacterium]MBS0550605.1 alpha/beta hydrolase [Pseudomonadota bacterium]